MRRPHEAAFPGRQWQRRGLLLLILLAVCLGLLGIYTLHTAPAVTFDSGLVVSLTAPDLQRIEDLLLEAPVFQRLPEFFTPRAETLWWQQQARLYHLLRAQQTVRVALTGPNGLPSTVQARVGVMPLSEVLHRTGLIYLVALLYIISGLAVFHRHASTTGALLAFFFLACALYFISSAPVVSRSLTLHPGYFKLFIKCIYAAAGGLITLVHFAFVFPRPKAILTRHAWLPWLLYGYFLLTVTLYLAEVIAFETTFPFFCLWILGMIGAFLHSLLQEEDRFLKQQIRLSLLAPILADFFFIGLYVLPGVLHIPPVQFTYFALFSLILPFALPVAMDNFRLYQERLETERQAQHEKERIREDLHDSILNNLAVLSRSAEVALHQLDRDLPGVRQRLQAIQDLSMETSRQVRGFLRVLDERYTTWADFGGYLRRWGSELVDPLDFALEIAPAVLALPPPALELKACLYQVYTEALSNIVKHAHAARVRVTLACHSAAVLCTIHDNGLGFRPAGAAAGHYGVTNMQKRVEALGGILTMATKAGEGTHLTFQLPLK